MPEQNQINQITSQQRRFTADKTIGYVLLGVGLLMIVIPVVLTISVLTGKSKPPQVLVVEAPSIQLPNMADSIELPAQLKAAGVTLNQKSAQPAGQKIISDEVFNFYINVGIFYLLMMFIASAGSKFATIGTHLIKDIKVKV